MDTYRWSHLGHAVHTVHQQPEQDCSDRPALLLVHGFGASTDHWRHNIPVLAKTHAVHAIDLLGFGRSSKPAELAYGGPLWRDQLVAYVQERIGRPTVIAGNSLGGFAALAAGAELKQDCAGVVLLNAAGPFSDEQQPPKGWAAIARQSIGSALLKSPVLQRLLFENLRRPAPPAASSSRTSIRCTSTRRIEPSLFSSSQAARSLVLNPKIRSLAKAVVCTGSPFNR